MCPWAGYAPATIAFCERRLCAWIVEPSNAWSNLAYLLAGLYIIWRQRRQLGSALTAIGAAAIALGLASFSFHATGARAFEVLDVSGMYLLSGLGLTFAIRRLWGLSDRRAMALFLFLFLASSGLMVLSGSNGIVSFAVQLTVAVLIEVRLWSGNPGPVRRAVFALCGSFLTAFAIWILDKEGIVCAPDNHFVTGHALWHGLTALSVWCFYLMQVRRKALTGST